MVATTAITTKLVEIISLIWLEVWEAANEPNDGLSGDGLLDSGMSRRFRRRRRFSLDTRVVFDPVRIVCYFGVYSWNVQSTVTTSKTI